MDDQARPASDSSPGEPAQPKTVAMDEKRRAALLAALVIGPIMLTLRGTPVHAQQWAGPVSCASPGRLSPGRSEPIEKTRICDAINQNQRP